MFLLSSALTYPAVVATRLAQSEQDATEVAKGKSSDVVYPWKERGVWSHDSNQEEFIDQKMMIWKAEIGG